MLQEIKANKDTNSLYDVTHVMKITKLAPWRQEQDYPRDY